MIGIVDYGIGNLGSILNMLRKLGVPAFLANDLATVRSAEKLILPGVGAFDHAMNSLRLSGLLPALSEMILERQTPVLAICLGMQLLTRGSQEGREVGLGWLPGETVRFEPQGSTRGIKVPHMGWNSVAIRKPSRLFLGLEEEARFYFVHSFHVQCDREEDILATTSHGHNFVSAIEAANIMGTQFHPEKSHQYGMRLLKNFAAIQR
jgi:glutamine amidotransferase